MSATQVSFPAYAVCTPRVLYPVASVVAHSVAADAGECATPCSVCGFCHASQTCPTDGEVVACVDFHPEVTH